MIFTEERLLSIWERLEGIGFILVIVGCLLEGVGNAPQKLVSKLSNGSIHLTERIGWILLIFGLALEFWAGGNAESIKKSKMAHLSDVASKRALEAEQLQAANLAMKANVLELERAVHELARSYDQTTNALAEANARLKLLKPIKERIHDLIEKISPELLKALRDGKTKFAADITTDIVDLMRRLKAEPGGSEYILELWESGGFSIVETAAGSERRVRVNFDLSQKLIE